jgi:hypothetical protein
MLIKLLVTLQHILKLLEKVIWLLNWVPLTDPA